MNISVFSMNTYTTGKSDSGSFFAGNLPILQGNTLKSTQEKLERQQKAQSQIDFYETQKANLKNMECDSPEEIAKKLEMFHSYESTIAAIKMQYNDEQKFHALEEAKELGEKIAEAAEENAPKTAEERREEMVEEALGLDEEENMIDEAVEEAAKMQDELLEEVEEEMKAAEDTMEKMQEELKEWKQEEEIKYQVRLQEDVEEERRQYGSVDIRL